jgi:VWFA-related protein
MLSYSRVRRCLCVLALGSTVVTPAVSAQEPVDRAARSAPSFRSSADLVSIQASVRDRRGRPLGSLTPGDFEVRDNGELRPILSMRADRLSPVSLAILVDMSGSMRVASKMDMVRQAIDTLLSQLRDGQDEVALFTFDSALHERRGFTTNLASIKDALGDARPFGSTSLYDATAATARRLSERSATHKAVIILTDGTDTSSAMTAPEVSGLASSIDVPVYVVATVPLVDQTALIEAQSRATSEGADLRNLAEWTGGQLVFASTFTETVVLAARLVDELRQRYVLAIEAASRHEWRRLEVRVKHPAAVVKARSGYFGG